MTKHRKLVNPETHEKIVGQGDFFYIISVDIGRISCQTVACVFKVFRNVSGFHSNLVNIYVLGKNDNDRHFEYQARDLKKLIRDFNPKEVIIDGNGMGVGILDFMTRTQIDNETNETLPAYGSFNDADMQKTQPKGIKQNIYVIKANTKLNSEIHSNCYNQIYSGNVNFLIKEQEAKNKLLATKVGQKMSPIERAMRLMPHEMTTKLLEEIANLRLKQSGTSDVVLEQINSRLGKDKFSSFEYGLWRIKELEEEYIRSKRKRSGTRKLMFYTPGG